MTDGVRERVIAIVAAHLGKRADEVTTETSVDLRFAKDGSGDALLQSLTREFGTEFQSDEFQRRWTLNLWVWRPLSRVLIGAAGVAAAAILQRLMGITLSQTSEKVAGAVTFVLFAFATRRVWSRRSATHPRVERVTVGRLIASVRRGVH